MHVCGSAVLEGPLITLLRRATREEEAIRVREHQSSRLSSAAVLPKDLVTYVLQPSTRLEKARPTSVGQVLLTCRCHQARQVSRPSETRQAWRTQVFDQLRPPTPRLAPLRLLALDPSSEH